MEEPTSIPVQQQTPGGCPKEVTIVTGFLGAGKTTFINHLLAAGGSSRHFIIENEFGKENIDAQLIQGAGGPVMEMTNGCICCSINDQLYEVLNELYLQRDDFDELIIEASGVADPAGIAEPFLLHPAVQKTFHLKCVICLVDCELIKGQLKESDEPIRQIAFSNILLLNKTDLVSAREIDDLHDLLSSLNPLARVMEFNRNSADMWAGIGGFDREKLLVGEGIPSPGGNKNQHPSVKSVTIGIQYPLKAQDVYFRLLQYLTFQAKGVFRIKGIFFDEENNGWLLQCVGKRIHIEPLNDRSPGRQTTSNFVFIGRNLYRESLEKMLHSCRGEGW